MLSLELRICRAVRESYRGRGCGIKDQLWAAITAEESEEGDLRAAAVKQMCHAPCQQDRWGSHYTRTSLLEARREAMRAVGSTAEFHIMNQLHHSAV